MRALALPLLALVGCHGPFAEVSGTIEGQAFDEVRSAFHAGPHIVLFTEEIDCMDADFVERAYNDGDVPTDASFVALQFSAMEAEVYNPGMFVFEPNSEVRSYGLVASGDAFSADRGREGFVSITDLHAGGDWIEGEFEVTFADDSVTGEFRTEYCRNMQP